MKKNVNQSKIISRVLTVLVILILLFSILSAGFTSIFFSVVFGRSDRIDPAELNYECLGEIAPQRKTLSFESEGNHLAGYLYLPEIQTKRGVVLIAAGIESGADSHLAETIYFLQNGFYVFVFDGTGIRQSEGRGVMGLSQSRIDTRNALALLREEPLTDSLPIFLYGHSVGGYACASLCGEKNVSAVVSISGFVSPKETMMWYGRKKVGFLADLESPFLWMQNRILFGDDADISAVDAINATATPILIIEGSEDRTVPAEIAISSFQNQISNPNVTFVTVSEPYRNGHSFSWLSSEAAQYRVSVSEDVTIDPLYANTLNASFMKQIVAFFEKSIT